MNKLRKPPSQQTSNTMRTALSELSGTNYTPSSNISVAPSAVDIASKSPQVKAVSSSWNTSNYKVHPHSGAEQYWASRALVAETILAARVSHYAEIQSVSHKEATPRQGTDLAVPANEIDAKHAMLERIIVLLVACVTLLVSIIIYLAMHTHHNSKQQQSWLTLPSHFTIPILSPFTSVIEQETSILSSRTIAVFILSLTCLAYFMFRLWLYKRPVT